MGRVRTWKRLNIPFFLVIIIACYMLFTNFLLLGNMRLCLFLSFMTLLSLYVSALSRPGPVPQLWKHIEEEPLTSYCRRCASNRPPRTHHCRYCDECIVRYDHHCDWIDNCVGVRNNKAFLLFLVYISLAILHYLFMFGKFFTFAHGPDDAVNLLKGGAPLIVALVLMIMYTFVVVPCAMLAFSFIWMGFSLVLRNETTYERDHDHGARLLYNKGLMQNWCEVFGNNPLLWCIPTLVEATNVPRQVYIV